jgi:two-component system sensor histidine kinase AlgZ
VDKMLGWPRSSRFDSRALRIIWLNLAVSLTLAFGIWVARGKTIDHHGLSDEIIMSLIHAAIYGGLFGFGLPYVSARLALLRRPWNSIFITASIAAVAIVGTFLVELCLLGLGYLTRADFWEEYAYKSAVVGILGLLIGWGVYLYESVRDHIQAMNLQLRTQELESERALKLATEAQLASLESKLHPHFLFNTLNSISALISADPLLADRMVQRLAGLLRTSLDACDGRRVSLGDEIALVTDYLEIEKARFGERLSYSIEAESETTALCVPPLILQPIVENSIKHAVFSCSGGGEIRISARVLMGKLVLGVCDDGPGFTTEMIPRGHGLDNLRSRLTALFRDGASLSINGQEGGTTVSVSIALSHLSSDE